VAKLDRELAELAGSYEIAEARLAASSPAYARLRQPEVRLGDLQREALDGGTILLEYFLAEPRSYLWRVTPDSLRSFELPGRERIEALAQRVREELGQPSPETGTAARQDLAQLAGMLLGPVAGELGDQRVAVVADGALLYVPFAALPVPAPAGGPTQGPAAEPLVVRHEVVHLPSAAVVRELRRARDGRPRAPAAVALLADPVFTPDDPRVRPIVADAAQVQDALRDGPRDAAATDSPVRPSDGSGEPWADLAGLPRRAGAGWRFLRLPWTRREAEVIAAEAGSRDKRIALDFAANREVATGGDLARYRIVHFATHGVLDTRHPALSGLVLSEVDERGRERDGFLRLHDIYHLQLGADLVVLSGCDTALGEVVQGEGIVGLARGFFHAGASQVVASLWPIRDRATAELMQLFYRAMFHDRLAPAAALRQAQLALRRRQPWRDPFFWAGFILEGDWRVPAP
jgi:CHAT domain-containing protein